MERFQLYEKHTNIWVYNKYLNYILQNSLSHFLGMVVLCMLFIIYPVIFDYLKNHALNLFPENITELLLKHN